MTSNSKISTLFFSAFVLCLSLSSCLNGSDDETIATNYQNATVTSFTISDNKDVCENLSDYIFTIDNFGKSDPELASQKHNAGIIFNADSLPAGAIPDSIKIELAYNGAPSSIYFRQYDDAGVLQNTVNFTDTQYISFDDYAVTRLDLVSQDGSWSKSYFIKINVHKTYGDTIRWQYRAQDLWDTAEITDQTAEAIDNDLYWFTETGETTSVRKSSLNSDIKSWSEPVALNTAEQPELSTVYAWNGSIYAVGKNGSLLSTADGCNWETVSSSVKFANILGVQYGTKKYNEHLHAIINEDGVYKFALSYDGTNWEVGDIIPDNFPIKNYSRPISDKAKPTSGNITSRLYIVGGETANGTVISSTWSCDGSNWAEFEQRLLPAMTRPSIIEYTLNTDAPKSFWILWPGILADGSVKNTAYFSENKGVTWKPLRNEFNSYAATSPISPVGAVSAFMNQDNYWMYFIGGVDADGKQQANIFGGQLLSLTYEKIQ